MEEESSTPSLRALLSEESLDFSNDVDEVYAKLIFPFEPNVKCECTEDFVVQSKISLKSKRSRTVSVCLTNCKYDVVRRSVSKLGFKDVGECDTWSFYWTDLSISIERCKEMRRFQRINHFPGMLEICRKDLLSRNLARMQRLFPKDYNYFPKTWCLPADLGDALTYSRQKRNKCFILKPDSGCQGRGIFITRSLKDLKPTDRMVCQVYVTHPFLIDGYKFDLRIYTLITSCDPLRIYIYKEGLVRFATSRYKEPTGVNITNVFMHLTNYAVNKHSRMYNFDVEAGFKRKISWLYNYLRSLGHDVDKLWHRIDDVIVKTVISGFPVLKHSYMACFPNHDVVPACCELLGVDILLDKRLNPIVLEVNHSPSFHTDTDLDCEVKEAMLIDMFKMLNLHKCDKRKIIREDKKRIRERLLHGSYKEPPCITNEPKLFADYYRYEMAHKGSFRLVYPLPHTEHHYYKFFDQGQGSLYCNTVCSRARESAQAVMRDELILKAKMEAAKRVAPLKPLVLRTKFDGRPVNKHTIPPIPLTIARSFKPQNIVESEENDRLQALAQRDNLIRNCGLFEQLCFSLKINGALRPQDELKVKKRKSKSRNSGDSAVIEPPTSIKSFEINDLLDEIREATAMPKSKPSSSWVTTKAIKIISQAANNRSSNFKPHVAHIKFPAL